MQCWYAKRYWRCNKIWSSKIQKENKETSDHEIYNQVEVLTPREIDALVYDKVTDVIETLDWNLQDKIKEFGTTYWAEEE